MLYMVRSAIKCHILDLERLLFYTLTLRPVYISTPTFFSEVCIVILCCTRNLSPRTTLLSVHFHEWSLSNACFLLSIKVTFLSCSKHSVWLCIYEWHPLFSRSGIFHQSCASFKFGFDHENASCLVLRCYKFEIHRHWAKPFYVVHPLM